MRSYSCYVSTMENGVLKNNGNTACFAGITGFYSRYCPKNKEGIVYISQFTEFKTKEYIPLLIKIINKITPCEIVKIDGVEYIKFALLETYDQSLILLNFIRNLWHNPDNYYKRPSVNYSLLFFQYLEKSKFIDPLKKLTSANKLACTEMGFQYCPGHSNCNIGEKLVLKKVSELHAYKGRSTAQFLTT